MRRRFPDLMRREGSRWRASGDGAAAPAPGGAPFNWYRPEDLVVGSSAAWPDSGSGEDDLVAVTVTDDPINGVKIGGKPTMGDGKTIGYFQNTTTSMSGNYEFWCVLRTVDVDTTQTALGYTGVGEQRLIMLSTGAYRINSGANETTSTGLARDGDVVVFRVTRASDGTGSIFIITDSSSSVTTAVQSGTAGTDDWDGLQVGSGVGGGWIGSIVEVLRYNDILADEVAQTTAAYLLYRYQNAVDAAQVSTESVCMCVGDSLTVGLSASDSKGFRSLLHAAFESADIEPGVRTLKFRGDTDDFCIDHSALAGRTISDVTSIIAAAIAAASPDVITLLIGTNDCIDAGFNLATATSDYEALLAAIYAADNSLPVVVCLLPPMSSGTDDANATALNGALTGTIIPGADSTITTVDLNTGIVPATHMTDGVHFNDAGYVIAAARIEAGIRTAIG